MDLKYISSDMWECWYVDGHVPLDEFHRVLGLSMVNFPPAAHGYLRATVVRGGVFAHVAGIDGWYEPCDSDARGASPITSTARNW